MTAETGTTAPQRDERPGLRRAKDYRLSLKGAPGFNRVDRLHFRRATRQRTNTTTIRRGGSYPQDFPVDVSVFQAHLPRSLWLLKIPAMDGDDNIEMISIDNIDRGSVIT
jgi:hypothetical protein